MMQPAITESLWAEPGRQGMKEEGVISAATCFHLRKRMLGNNFLATFGGNTFSFEKTGASESFVNIQ